LPWLVACASGALDMAPARADRPWLPATGPQGEIIAGATGSSALDGGYVLPPNLNLADPSSSPLTDPTKVYALADLIDLAETSNPSTRIAWNDARRAALAAGVAQSAYLPRVTAGAAAAYQTSDNHASALGASVGDNGSASGAIAAVSMQWLLFDFGERSAVVDAAKQLSVISNIAFTAAHQQVIYEVTVAFYANAAAKAHLATATESLKNAQAVEAAADDRFKHGVGTVIELAQARQATAQANLALVQSRGGAQDAYLALLSAMGVSPRAQIQVADVSGRKLSPQMAVSADAILNAALARRPDVLSAYAAQNVTQANVRVAQAEFRPKVFVAATGAYNAAQLGVTALPGVADQASIVNIDGRRLSGSVFAGVTVPLYDGGMRTAALARARAEADSAAARLTRVRDEAIRQIVASDNALRTSLATLEACEQLTAAAQTTFDAALEAYRSGVGSITDLTLAQSQLLQAKTAAADAYSTALSAAATLALASGALGAVPQ
jgi:outer membrane protein TolC